jgi:hypothetical protein
MRKSAHAIDLDVYLVSMLRIRIGCVGYSTCCLGVLAMEAEGDLFMKKGYLLLIKEKKINREEKKKRKRNKDVHT